MRDGVGRVPRFATLAACDWSVTASRSVGMRGFEWVVSMDVFWRL